MFPIQFYLDDEPLGDVKLSRKVPAVGQGVTLEHTETGRPADRFRVVDVDHGYVQTNPKGTTYKDSTVAVYLIAHDDPRRERP